jgi:signal transduction histidine kinase
MADRIFLYVLEEDPSRPPVFNLSFGWEKSNLNTDGPGTIRTALPLETLEKHLPGLLSGRPYHGLFEDVASPELQQYLHRQGTLAMIVFPIFIQEDFWGFLGFDQCTLADIWPPEVFSTLGAFVSSLEKTIERHLMQRDLTLAWETAQKASAMKSQFLSNMSHEIRTPINAILGYTSLLEDIISQEEGRHYLSAVQKAGNMLVGLISDILDLAKIESGEIKLQQDYINVRRIYEDIADVFELKTKENQITLEIQVDPSVPDLIIQDETRFRQILFNLVGNAVKFTHEGGIVISARQFASSEETGTVDLTFSVKDTGIGIPEGEQEKIFDPFKQKDNQNASVYGGTGLGLSIARRLVEQMGGEIRLHSEEGKGSEFLINLYGVKTVGATGSFSAMMKQARALEKGPVRSRAAASEPSAEVIPPEAKALLETIQGDAWLHARQTQSMDSSRRFAGEVAEVAGNYDLSSLKSYSENLAEALGTYNARKIRQLLEAFPRVAAIKGGDGS